MVIMGTSSNATLRVKFETYITKQNINKLCRSEHISDIKDTRLAFLHTHPSLWNSNNNGFAGSFFVIVLQKT